MIFFFFHEISLRKSLEHKIMYVPPRHYIDTLNPILGIFFFLTSIPTEFRAATGGVDLVDLLSQTPPLTVVLITQL